MLSNWYVEEQKKLKIFAHRINMLTAEKVDEDYL
jgi:hypothetical protein